MSVEPIFTTAYQGAGRRYFSKRAAERSFAKAAISRRCECEEYYACRYHKMNGARFERMIRLYVAMFVRRSKAVARDQARAGL